MSRISGEELKEEDGSLATTAPPTGDQAGSIAAPADGDTAVPIRKVDRRIVTAALMLIMVLASMEMTVTSTAMPTIIGDLHGLEHYSWVASVYLLACTVTMPLYGRLADVLGRKKVILGATIVFTIGSVLSAYSQSMYQLIVYRAIQGLGAGGIMPVVLTILGDLFTLEERARIQGFFSAVWGTSALAGPALGAFIVHTLGWRWIFWVNLPVGLIGVFLLVLKYHDRQKPHSTALDLPGIGALSLGSLALLALVSRLGPGGWSWAWIVGLLAVTVGCIVFLVWHERRTENPVMPPDLMLRREIGPSILGTFFFGAAFMCLDTYVPLYVQGGRGGGAAAAASVVTPVMMTWALSGILAAPLMVRWGFRKTALLGCSLILVGFTGLLVCALTEAPQHVMTAVLAITGFGFGPASMSYLISAQDAVTWQHRGIVTSAVGFFRTIGGAMGIGLLGAMFNFLSRDELNRLADAGVPPAAALDPHLQETLAPEVLTQVRDTIASSLIWVFAVMLLLTVLQFAMTLLLRGKRKPDHEISTMEAFDAGVA